jgi:hypothetical protein
MRIFLGLSVLLVSLSLLSGCTKCSSDRKSRHNQEDAEESDVYEVKGQETEQNEMAAPSEISTLPADSSSFQNHQNKDSSGPSQMGGPEFHDRENELSVPPVPDSVREENERPVINGDYTPPPIETHEDNDDDDGEAY